MPGSEPIALEKHLGELTGLGYEHGIKVRAFRPVAGDMEEQRIHLGKLLSGHGHATTVEPKRRAGLALSTPLDVHM